MTAYSEYTIRRAVSIDSLNRRASLNAGKKHMMFVFALNTKVHDSSFKEALSCSSFEGLYLLWL